MHTTNDRSIRRCLLKSSLVVIACCLYCALALSQPVKHVILISIDGLRPEMYQDKSWPTPNLQFLMKQGTYAKHLKSVFPAYTYPSHTAMVTGALPARSGIAFNQPKNSKGEWNWFADSIKVPTIWQAMKKNRLTTAAVEWPLSVNAGIDYCVPEIWDNEHPEDRITAARRYATPGLVEAIEANATGKLDSNSMSEEYFMLDENAGRMAAYIIQRYKPSLLALHFACVDGMQHGYGRDHDSVGLAVAVNDRAIGDVLEAIQRAGLQDSTAVIIVGDHGFVTIHEAFRPNMLIRDLPARFIAAGGSAFLYLKPGTAKESMIHQVMQRLDSLPADKRKQFRIIDRKELDRMGADSAAVLALAAVPGLVFSGAITQNSVTNSGPGTLIQQNPLEGMFIPVSGGHHGYDPDIPEMYTGFIAAGAGINNGKTIEAISEPDIAPLIAKLLGIEFNTPDGKLVPGILKNE